MSQPPSRGAGAPPRFVSGSIPRHILGMTGAGAVGLMAIFLGEFANVLFLSWLGDVDIIAAAGYASTILFLLTSVGIGTAIAAGALVSPALGSGDHARARRLSVNAHLFSLAIGIAASVALWLAVPKLVALLGASGRPHELATRYLRIIVPFMSLLGIGMCSSAVLRSAGDARRSMNVTLIGAAVNVALDPLLIFTFGLGMDGAAWATNISRLAVVAVGLHAVIKVHDLIAPVRVTAFLHDARVVLGFALPAILTNLATPVANAYVTWAMASYGTAAVAAWTIIGRISPVAFGAIFALSGSIGPILGQNMGARQWPRVQAAFDGALAISISFTFVAWLALALAADPLVSLFGASGETASLVTLFCRVISPMFAFLGVLFVTNAAFNALGYPHYPTMLNWGRATLGTIPLVYLGGMIWGPAGVIAASLAGAGFFALAGAWICRRLIARMAERGVSSL